MGGGVRSRHGVTAKNVGAITPGSGVALLRNQGIAKRMARWDTILAWTYIDLTHHAHLQVLGRSDMAVPEVSAGIGSKIVIGETSADVDGDRRVRNTIIKSGGVGITVEVNGMLL